MTKDQAPLCLWKVCSNRVRHASGYCTHHRSKAPAEATTMAPPPPPPAPAPTEQEQKLWLPASATTAAPVVEDVAAEPEVAAEPDVVAPAARSTRRAARRARNDQEQQSWSNQVSYRRRRRRWGSWLFDLDAAKQLGMMGQQGIWRNFGSYTRHYFGGSRR